MTTHPPFPPRRPSRPRSDLSAAAAGRRVRAQVGHRINQRYRLTRMLGQGGMGVVYEAYDEQVDRRVAIKLVRKDCLADEKFKSRFARELEITARLRHPSTIRVFEHGSDDQGRPYMVMELLRGESLADVLDRGALPELQALEYALQIAESLSEAHEHGIFHRDLKPENIYIESVGVSTVVKVLDFGIAGSRYQDDRITNAGEVFGTPQYMSPEQCNGAPLDPRTDIYSLGCILFEMLEGHPPFCCETPMATMLKHVQSKIPRMRNASRECARLIMQCLRKDRDRRIQSCAGLASMIQELQRSLDLQSTNTQPSLLQASQELPTVGAAWSGPQNNAAAEEQRQQRERQAKRALPMLGLAFILVAGALVFLELGRGDDSSELPNRTAEQLPSAAQLPTDDPGHLPINYALIGAGIRDATASLDGAAPCPLPCRLEVPVGDGIEHTISIEKTGFVPKTLRWKPKTVTEAPPAIGKLRRK